MKNSPYPKPVLAKVALELMPPMVRQSLLEESEFRQEYGFKADAVVSFGDSGVSFQRSRLFDAVRKVLSGALVKEVSNKDGQRWKLKNVAGKGDLPSLVLTRSKQKLILPDFTALSSDQAARIRSLDRASLDVNLPNSARESWRNVLAKRALTNEEVDVFHSDFRDTPVQKARLIRSEIIAGESSLSSLVPRSRRYFERLAGTYDGSASIRDYAAGSGKKLFHELSAWRPYDGFLSSLFLSSHSSLTAEINVDQLTRDDLVRAFDFLDKHGDRISQMGAVEIGFRVLPSTPELEPILIRIIDQIRDDNVDEKGSGFQLLSALFILVDGELSRTRLFSSEPPFYRRLAALSQAALIHRQLMNSGIDSDRFVEWATNHRGEQFYMQSLADMRREPRWDPDFVTALQIKADFYGRIMVAGKNYEQNIKDSELHDLIFAATSGSLHSLIEFPRPYLPGPLEGAEESQVILPSEMSKEIEIQLGAEEVKPSSFIALVNAALIFRVRSDQAELAAKALKLSTYRLADIKNKLELIAVLNGLATVAAVAKSRSLADELRILVRRYRRDAEFALSIEEAMKICLVAAASRANLNDWREFVGDWLTELAFSDLASDEGKRLYSHMQCICHAVPELWASCGRADAALMAYNGI